MSPTESLVPSAIPSMTPTQSSNPSAFPTDSQSPSSSPSVACSERNQTVVLFETLSEVTDPAILLDPATPQGEAFQWFDESGGVDVCTYPTAQQRYALAVLYFSTNGDGWTDNTGWLSGLPECGWFGVTCDAAFIEFVTALDLRKYYAIEFD